MAVANKRVIVLRGEPIINEDGVASATIKPGHLVDGVTSVAPHAVAGGLCQRTFALERDEMGAGVDDSHKSVYAPAANYAVGDTVKIGSFAPGMRVNVRCAAGVNIVAGDKLESAGDGTLRKFTTGVILARSLESSGGALGAESFIRAEII